MTCSGDLFIRTDPNVLQRRFSAYVRPFPAKVLARKADCSERTAEAWREGRSWPTGRHWLALVREFGRDLTESVFHPDAAAARLQEEVAHLEAELAAKRRALGVVAPGGRRSPSRMAEGEGQGRSGSVNEERG